MNSNLLCSCNLHPLFLSQVTVRFNSCSCISERDKDVLFLTTTSIWKLSYYSPQNVEALKGILAVGFPELKIVKLSDTRWLSHECCVMAICKELPPLLQTFSQLYESTGDA